MLKPDYFHVNKPQMQRSPGKKIQTIKVTSCIPTVESPRSNRTKLISIEKQNSQDQIKKSTNPRTKFSSYEKFMCQVDTKIEKNQQVQSLHCKNPYVADRTNPETQSGLVIQNKTQDVQKQETQIYTSPATIYLPKVYQQRNSMHANPSLDRFAIISNNIPYESIGTRLSYYQPPSQEFYLGRQKPIRISHLNIKEDSSLFNAQNSPKIERKVTKNFFSYKNLHFPTKYQCEEFRETNLTYKFLNMKQQKQDEDNFTIKLRSSLANFQQKHKPQNSTEQSNEVKTPSSSNKITRAFSQYSYQVWSNKKRYESRSEQGKKSQSEEKIRVVDIFQERQPKTDDQRPATNNTKSEHQPSMVERNLTKKLIFNQHLDSDTLTHINQINQDANKNYQFSQEKSLLPSRQRIFSTKIALKTPLIQQHFAPSSQAKLNDSKDILYNLHQKLQGPQRSNNAYIINDSDSNINFIKNQPKTVKKNLNVNPNSENPQSQYFTESPIIMPYINNKKPKPKEQIKNKFLYDEYQIQSQVNKSPDLAAQTPSNDLKLQKYYSQDVQSRANSERTDHILDLLLLSTCELKNYFNPGSADKQIIKSNSKKVKVVQSKQRFPNDFFNVINT